MWIEELSGLRSPILDTVHKDVKVNIPNESCLVTF